MAEIKFNFYNIYSNYYRNINGVSKFNVFMYPHYEIFNNNEYYMETMSLIYKNKLPLYVLHELRQTEKVDYKVYKSLKKINRKKIVVKTIYEFKNCNYKIYNLFKL